MENVEFRSAGVRLAGQLYLPDSKQFAPPHRGVVVAHGIGSRKENHAPFCEYLVERGIATLAFDFRGHGESEGMLDQATEEDVPAALDFLAVQPHVAPDRLGLRGSSMGAFFALRAAARHTSVRAIAAIAPAMDVRFASGIESGFMQRLLERNQMNARIDPESFLRGLRRHDTRVEIVALAPRALLLIQCKGDELVPFAWTEELFARAKEPKELLLIENGNHVFAQQDIDVHQTTLEWFQRYL